MSECKLSYKQARGKEREEQGQTERQGEHQKAAG